MCYMMSKQQYCLFLLFQFSVPVQDQGEGSVADRWSIAVHKEPLAIPAGGVNSQPIANR